MATLAIAAWAGMGNLGDDWLATTATAVLAEHEVVPVREPSSPGVEDRPAASVAWPRVTARGGLAELRHFREELQDFDAVVLAGGGWLAGDQGLRSPARWLARLLATNVPIVACGIGVGPFPTRRSLWLGRQVLRRVKNHLSVRSPRDFQWVRQASGRTPILATDLALASAYGATSRSERSGVIVSMPAPRGHWWGGSAGEYRQAVEELANQVSKGETVRFVHFQHGPGGDAEFWEGQASAGPRSVEDAIEAYSRARVVVAGRLHAALLASIAGTAMIPFGYHHKFSVLNSLGVTAYPIAQLVNGAPRIRNVQYANPESVIRARDRAHEDLRHALEALDARNHR